MSVFALGDKALRRFCEEQSPLLWFKAKLVKEMFRPPEQAAFEWVDQHVRKHHVLPQLETLLKKFPQFSEVVAPEPPSYYLDHLETRHFSSLLNEANLKSQAILEADPGKFNEAMAVLKEATSAITRQKFRLKIIDVAQEGPGLILQAYHNVLLVEKMAEFGWPYLDDMTGGLMGGDVVSFVGRPAAGKTFLSLNTGLFNWRLKRSVLFVSMEMSPIPILQRIAAMYGHTDLTQLKQGGYSTTAPKGGTSTYKKFVEGLQGMAHEEAKFYVIDGNLAASVDDIYELAAQLQVDIVIIDGAYLCRHKNPRLDRYTKVAENVELMKQHTTAIERPTFASWQFNRDAGKKKGEGKKGGMEDIAFSDAIGQISSVVLGLFQEDTVETLYQRHVDVLKGRNGEIGGFDIEWLFDTMRFNQINTQAQAEAELEYV
jgi:replicative DNA helicase